MGLLQMCPVCPDGLIFKATANGMACDACGFIPKVAVVKEAASAGNIARILNIPPEIAQIFVNHNRSLAFALAKIWLSEDGAGVLRENWPPDAKIAMVQGWLNDAAPITITILQKFPDAVKEISNVQGMGTIGFHTAIKGIL